jgi:hypothetical protein
MIAAVQALVRPPLLTALDTTDPPQPCPLSKHGHLMGWFRALLYIISAPFIFQPTWLRPQHLDGLQEMLHALRSINHSRRALREVLWCADSIGMSIAGAQVVLQSGIMQHLLQVVPSMRQTAPFCPTGSLQGDMLLMLGSLLAMASLDEAAQPDAASTSSASSAHRPGATQRSRQGSSGRSSRDVAGGRSMHCYTHSQAAWELEQRLAHELLRYDLSRLVGAEVHQGIETCFDQTLFYVATYVVFLTWHPSLQGLSAHDGFLPWLARFWVQQVLHVGDTDVYVDGLSRALCQGRALSMLAGISSAAASSSPGSSDGAGADGDSGPSALPVSFSGYPANGTSALLEALLSAGLLDYLRTLARQAADAHALNGASAFVPLLGLLASLVTAYPCRMRSCLMEDHLAAARALAAGRPASAQAAGQGGGGHASCSTTHGALGGGASSSAPASAPPSAMLLPPLLRMLCSNTRAEALEHSLKLPMPMSTLRDFMQVRACVVCMCAGAWACL